MTTRELQRTLSNATYTAKVRVTQTGEIERESGDVDASAYGPVEVAWYPDRLKITALGAGRGSMLDEYLSGTGEDVIIEIRLPSLDDLIDVMPGAD